MVALHGTWVLRETPYSPRFALWAETVRTSRARATPGRASVLRTASDAVPRHPFAITGAALKAALVERGGRAAAEGARVEEAVALLPTAGGRPVPSPAALIGAEAGAESSATLAPWRVPAIALEADAAVTALLALAGETPPDVRLGDDLRYWITATRFALALLRRQRLVPAIERYSGRGSDGAMFVARWRPLLDEPDDERRFERLAEAMPPVCRALSWDVSEGVPPGPRRVLESYVSHVVDAVARSTRSSGVTWVSSDGRRAGRRSAVESWWRALFGGLLVDAPAAEASALYDQLRPWVAGDQARGAESFRVCFRLVPPESAGLDVPAAYAEIHRDAPAEALPETHRNAQQKVQASGGGNGAAGPRWLVEYLLQATDDPSLLVPAAEVWQQRGATARFLNRRLDNPQERLLAGLGRAARHVPPVETSLRAARPEACVLTTDEAHRFIRDWALVLRAAGFGVLVPGLDSRLRLRIRLKSAPAAPGTSSGGPAAFGWDTLVAYDWQVAVGDETLSREEFLELARLKVPLVQVRGQWVELDAGQIEQALSFLERRADGGELPVPEALQLALAPNGHTGLPIEHVEADGWIETLLRDLRGGARRRRLKEPPGFAGTLRPYQRVGVSWLATLERYGIGACLADDMGLGKTVQVIALLLHDRRHDDSRRPTLLVCPTSVVGNWRRELGRFAPSLKVLVHHGAGRTREGFAEEAAAHDVVVSTYALLHRDEAALLSVDWERVILDEAQNVKNAATRASQTARKLPARWRSALTGTPVENRLAELWSIFQFLNPGYLGSAEEFRRRFAGPIERANDAAAMARLKALVGPFILRRLKTDRTIIQDLPEKQEMKVFCSLTREQATLYEAVVKESMRAIEEADGIERRGQILATLTKLKQVCDHPALFLHDRSALAGRSGKLARLSEMLEEALAVDDRALIFTQYAEMGRLLKTHLETVYGQEVLFLHGGVPAAERDRIVARFQGDDRRAPRLFVLSIKAGGTGLNLTQANHVFHFDRWWNPAVENQATDRAFRIGQTRNVQVHKFICAGTFEEALDEMIERKVALSEAIVGTSEVWITELSTSELKELFALRRASGDVADVADVTAAGGGDARR